jgi:hypothetical protein
MEGVSVEQISIERWEVYLWTRYTYKGRRCFYGTGTHRKMEVVSMELIYI